MVQRTSLSSELPKSIDNKDIKTGECEDENTRIHVKKIDKESNCMCPNCGRKIAHKPGESCSISICPQCGSQMMRE